MVEPIYDVIECSLITEKSIKNGKELIECLFVKLETKKHH